MNLKALVTTLVLGSSSAAMASPAVAFHGSVSIGTTAHYAPAQPARTVVRDRGWVSTEWRDRGGYEPAPVYVHPTQPQSIDACDNIAGSYYRGPVGRMPSAGHARIALTAPTKIENGREIIAIGADKGVFTELTLQATSGATFIRDIAVDMGSGDIQTIRVNQWLDARNQAVSFDIDGRRGRSIVALTVNGQSNFGSRYTITSDR